MIGVALITYNRPENRIRISEAIAATMPAGSLFVIAEDDGYRVEAEHQMLVSRTSAVPYLIGPRAGVVGNRNRAIRYLLDAGCEWIVLVDDDVLPLQHGWAERLIWAAEATDQAFMARVPTYGDWPARITEGEQHRQSLCLLTREGSLRMDVVWNFWATNTVIAVHRRAYEAVGLYDESYEGYYGHDDVEWQYRLPHAGLVKAWGHPHVAPEAMDGFIEDIACDSSIAAERDAGPEFMQAVARNGERMERMRREHAARYGSKS